jgi:putative restriction endonuclease
LVPIPEPKALPVLQVAHIGSVTKEGSHRVENRLLLRSDIHTLFDQAYVTVAPNQQFRASRLLKTDFDKDESYYPLSGQRIWLPSRDADQPGREFLEWHADTVYRG